MNTGFLFQLDCYLCTQYDLIINKTPSYKVVNTIVDQYYDIFLDSLDGSLEAKVNNGSTDIFISRPDVITIETETGKCGSLKTFTFLEF